MCHQFLVLDVGNFVETVISSNEWHRCWVDLTLKIPYFTHFSGVIIKVLISLNKWEKQYQYSFTFLSDDRLEPTTVAGWRNECKWGWCPSLLLSSTQPLSSVFSCFSHTMFSVQTCQSPSTNLSPQSFLPVPPSPHTLSLFPGVSLFICFVCFGILLSVSTCLSANLPTCSSVCSLFCL